MNPLFTALLALLSVAASAGEEVPTTAVDIVKSVVTVNGVKYNYTVKDEGWGQDSYTKEDKTASFSARKYLTLTYDLLDPEDVHRTIWQESLVKTDLEERCLEFARTESERQAAPLPKTFLASFGADVTFHTSDVPGGQVIHLLASCVLSLHEKYVSNK